MNNFRVDRAAEYVKNIVDSNRCHFCDRIDGLRLRYTCGHSVCDDCVISAEDCLICLTPPKTSNSTVEDEVFTKRVENAALLLKAFEKLFHIDVYKRQRISDQQKIEKELFPHCIQAPAKYENKRKSSIRLSKDKENKRISFFPGENISPIKDSKMENSVSYVQQWLNKNERNGSRKPFADLNINQTYIKNLNNSKNIEPQKDNAEKINDYSSINRKSQKRSHSKTTVKKNLSSLERKTSLTHNYSKKAKKDFHVFEDISNYDEILNPQTKNDDESGIVIIDEEPIVIDDTQDTINDKDKQAWLAVIEANKKDELETTLLDSSKSYASPKTNKKLSGEFPSTNQRLPKVPFYKKSYLFDLCGHGNNKTVDNEKSKEVNITIESDSFLITIKVINDVEGNKVNCKKSVPVQTNISDICHTNNFCATGKNTPLVQMKCKNASKVNEAFFDEPSPNESQSQDVLVDVETNYDTPIQQEALIEKTGVTIEESDTDDEIENSGPMHVTVDIHRSYCDDEIGVLAEVEDLEVHSGRPRRAPRGYTPTSTDSSDKENFNPNRHKTNRREGKKKYVKK